MGVVEAAEIHRSFCVDFGERVIPDAPKRPSKFIGLNVFIPSAFL
jgi:hypothetical protein